MVKQSINVEVCYAAQTMQFLQAITLAAGATISDAIQASEVLQAFPEIDLAINKVGIFSRLQSLDQVLQDGDRVEIYRPLLIDPKDARRKRARG